MSKINGVTSMAKGPTIYNTPGKSIGSKKPTDRAKVKWEKHREKVGKDTTLPKLKN